MIYDLSGHTAIYFNGQGPHQPHYGASMYAIWHPLVSDPEVGNIDPYLSWNLKGFLHLNA